jgi:alpha-tubulin suppressor-like RCC1 family protein
LFWLEWYTKIKLIKIGNFQCGVDNCFEDILEPIKVPFLSDIKIKQISCGYFHSLLLTDDGDVYGMGRNIEGQLGLDDIRFQEVPTILESYSEDNEIIILENVKKMYSKGNISVFIINDKLITNYNKNYLYSNKIYVKDCFLLYESILINQIK